MADDDFEIPPIDHHFDDDDYHHSEHSHSVQRQPQALATMVLNVTAKIMRSTLPTLASPTQQYSLGRHDHSHHNSQHHHGQHEKHGQMSRYHCDGMETVMPFIPLFNEEHWPEALRAFLYFLGLAFVFVGIAYAVDRFMSAIEKICTQTIRVRNKHAGPGKPEYKDVPFWNPTVATLTLGAVGTTSPEIVLTTIEVVGSGFEAGDLGPGTIIGSAAFNLLITTAVCIMSIPKGQRRRIHHLPVYYTTTGFSILAYGWLIYVLAANGDGKIEVWEAVITLLLYPVLVISVYLADKLPKILAKRREQRLTQYQFNGSNFHLGNYGIPGVILSDSGISSVCSSGAVRNGLAKQLSGTFGQTILFPSVASNIPHASGQMSVGMENIANLYLDSATKLLRNATAQEVADEIAQHMEDAKPKSQAYYRANHGAAMNFAKLANTRQRTRESSADNGIATIEFATQFYSVVEEDRIVEVRIVRKGEREKRRIIRYETIEGTATPGEDYVHVCNTFTMEPYEMEKLIAIEILQNEEEEADEVFYVKLSLVDLNDWTLRMGKVQVAEITIIGEVQTSLIEFKDRRMIVKESDGLCEVKVHRKGKTHTAACVSWYTKDVTAVNKQDYIADAGVLRFEPGEQEKEIKVLILDTLSASKNVTFSVRLTGVSSEVELGSKNSTIVTIISDESMQEKLAQADKIVSEMLEEKADWRAAWRKQFICSMNVNDGDIVNAKPWHYCLHAVSFSWKTTLALLVPPAELWRGYPTFVTAFLIIAFLTAIVSDFAKQFGCICHLDELLIGAILLSVGINVPDLFASRFAALADEEADAAILHISGGCCVNVFLGLGIPWVMASAYWNNKGRSFKVDSADVGWCAIVYTILAVVSLTIFTLRRYFAVFGKAELGGPKVPKIATGVLLVAMWIAYILLAHFKYDLPGLTHH